MSQREQSAPAGRPRGFETERVLDAALALFWRRGYRATTTRELESGLGLRQSSLYNAFGSKRGLLEAALDRYEALASEELLRPLRESDEGLLAIESFLAALAAWVSGDGRRGCLLTNMTIEELDVRDQVSLRAQSYRRLVRDALRDALARAAARGEIGGADLDGRADLLLGLVLGINVTARGPGGSGELERLVGAGRSLLSAWRRRRR